MVLTQTITRVYKDSFTLWYPPSINIWHVLQFWYWLGGFFHTIMDIVYWYHAFTSVPATLVMTLHRKCKACFHRIQGIGPLSGTDEISGDGCCERWLVAARLLRADPVQMSCPNSSIATCVICLIISFYFLVASYWECNISLEKLCSLDSYLLKYWVPL